VFFHHQQHPRKMGAPEVEAFLTDLAVNRKFDLSPPHATRQTT
jgi:hypothetical protein